ncbi:uncharacterized protein PRCAT00000404001 [Priceomyces carsonii]|uniref:uncharacterized protein n=1 Tax=Priceomyces carsonii TaxID=28549 RepID=UPI002ED97768|nr:unnamed protein product [Priceomyces carsonii]
MSQSFSSSTLPLSFVPSHDNVPKRHDTTGLPQGGGSFTDEESNNVSPIIDCMLAGAFGGFVGDSSMHSLDTVKTRQQGFPKNLQYKKMIPAYLSIFKNEGIRGLYGGYSAAVLGSLPSTATFFGTYEFTKRELINGYGFNETISYFVAGVLGDLFSSVFYVPSEVLKTRLQLQGVYDNPFTKECGYKYKSLSDAIFSIFKKEGVSTLTFGYKETLLRDLPFSALQFAFYEKFRQLAIYSYESKDLPIWLELTTGAGAGGLAGILTTPLDVIKTRIQTSPSPSGNKTGVAKSSRASLSPSNLSTLRALQSVYKSEGILGLFSGVGPRFIWTSIQSSIMLLLYQISLKQIDLMLTKESLLA